MKEEQKEHAILIGVNVKDQSDFQESMEELKNLTIAREMSIAGVLEQNLKSVHPAHYIGAGKVEEIKLLLTEKKANVLIFNNELSPSQLHNLETELGCRILDRTTLILEIFSERAKTREAKLQVEVAKLQYLLPRLVGTGENLGRQSGGVGTKNRGSGEKKLELDKRKIETKISELNHELEALSKERETQRKKRKKTDISSIALVGYTNSGKYTLMNAMVETYKKPESKKVLEKDMLFATLETSVRSIYLPNHKMFFLSDTVGFVSDLPHELVKAFRTTLEEVIEADLLLHIVDYSNPNYKKQIKVTTDTLNQIGASHIPVIYVYNKSELTDISIPTAQEDRIYLSAKNRIGIGELVEMIEKQIYKLYIKCSMLIPYSDGSVVSYLNEHAIVESVEHIEEGTFLTLQCKESDYHKFKQYVKTNNDLPLHE
ncbi:MAG: GTPase HflX [Leptospiraceae bacterium]|nr:GTPase HflX [Leptospiraceae bacterium]